MQPSIIFGVIFKDFCCSVAINPAISYPIVLLFSYFSLYLKIYFQQKNVGYHTKLKYSKYFQIFLCNTKKFYRAIQQALIIFVAFLAFLISKFVRQNCQIIEALYFLSKKSVQKQFFQSDVNGLGLKLISAINKQHTCAILLILIKIYFLFQYKIESESYMKSSCQTKSDLTENNFISECPKDNGMLDTSIISSEQFEDHLESMEDIRQKIFDWFKRHNIQRGYPQEIVENIEAEQKKDANLIKSISTSKPLKNSLQLGSSRFILRKKECFNKNLIISSLKTISG